MISKGPWTASPAASAVRAITGQPPGSSALTAAMVSGMAEAAANPPACPLASTLSASTMIAPSASE